MDVIPAVDIMDRKVVRLTKGDPQTAKMYEGFKDPVQTAMSWERQGATYIHVVDLDAAIGRGNNRQVISEIIREVDVAVQVGGGIRNRAVAEEILTTGASRVIVGTLAFENEDLLKMLLKEFGFERIMVALDYLNGLVMTKGWKNVTGIALIEAMKKFLNLGVEFFLLTSISRDGLLTGPDFITLKAMTKLVNTGLFIAGGVNSLDDVVKLKSIDVNGVIIGKALYEGKINFKEALNAVRV